MDTTTETARRIAFLRGRLDDAERMGRRATANTIRAELEKLDAEDFDRPSPADRLLTIDELAERVSDAYGCRHELHLAIPEKVA